ncbi:MAG: hypothetical protein ACM3SY_04585 [Candidatus Omnitrophota bacterium]
MIDDGWQRGRGKEKEYWLEKLSGALLQQRDLRLESPSFFIKDKMRTRDYRGF